MMKKGPAKKSKQLNSKIAAKKLTFYILHFAFSSLTENRTTDKTEYMLLDEGTVHSKNQTNILINDRENCVSF